MPYGVAAATVEEPETQASPVPQVAAHLQAGAELPDPQAQDILVTLLAQAQVVLLIAEEGIQVVLLIGIQWLVEICGQGDVVAQLREGPPFRPEGVELGLGIGGADVEHGITPHVPPQVEPEIQPIRADEGGPGGDHQTGAALFPHQAVIDLLEGPHAIDLVEIPVQPLGVQAVSRFDGQLLLDDLVGEPGVVLDPDEIDDGMLVLRERRAGAQIGQIGLR